MMMIERIRREHGYMTRLLAILRQKHQRLESEKSVNYSLIQEIVDYLASHSEAVHHPKEDIIYHYYIEKFGNRQEIVDLASDHKALAEKTHDFLNMVEMILQDAVVPQHIFLEQLADFIKSQKRHLDLEEQQVLPLINKTFELSDWQAVEAQWHQTDDDPVFGDTIAERYKQLALRVRENKTEAR
jgi:hemerythrin-like domain-containing protein